MQSMTILVARRWRLSTVLMTVAVSWLLWVTLASPVAVPGRFNVSFPLWPLVPALVALGIANSAVVLTYTTELVGARSLLVRRSAQVAAASVAIALLVMVVPDDAWRPVILRNAMILAGLGYALVGLGNQTLAALAIVALTATSWLIGTTAPFDEPAAWAILVKYDVTAIQWAIACGSAAAGAVLYIARSNPIRSQSP
jgi:hypothetical protein